MSPMRVAMWSDSFYPYVSGVTKSVDTLRKTLIELGHEVDLYCPNYPGTVDHDRGIKRLPSFPAPTNRNYYVAIPSVPGLFGEVKRSSPDVIHSHSPFNLGKRGIDIGRKIGIPVVLTYHTMYNMYAHYVPVIGQKIPPVIESLALATCRECDLVITPTKTIQEYLLEKGLKTPCMAIPNGIDLSPFSKTEPSRARQTYGIPEGVPLVVTSARLGKEKNLEVLLEAFAHSSKKVESFLLIAGDGPLKHHLKQLTADLGISRNVVFAGFVKPEFMPHIYAAGDVFLFTSLTDTQGLVILEAKASGLPAIAVAALGVKDMIRDGIDGYLCPNDPAALAEKVVYLLTNQGEREAMSRNARKSAQSFSREAQASKILDAYERLIRGQPVM